MRTQAPGRRGDDDKGKKRINVQVGKEHQCSIHPQRHELAIGEVHARMTPKMRLGLLHLLRLEVRCATQP